MQHFVTHNSVIYYYFLYFATFVVVLNTNHWFPFELLPSLHVERPDTTLNLNELSSPSSPTRTTGTFDRSRCSKPNIVCSVPAGDSTTVTLLSTRKKSLIVPLNVTKLIF